MKKFGKKFWAIADGHIPLESTGHEPENTSRDEISILNLQQKNAKIEIMIYFADSDPVGPFNLIVKAERVRKIRVNDLIDPQAIPLATDYGGTVSSDVPVIVQFTRIDTGVPGRSTMSLIASS